ncbi:MAG: hypothetical protein PUD59_05600 [bacterium]|nr:hypothetical protein [bacterium]
MNELVNFKKIDIIKEMIKEKEQSIESKIDYDNTILGNITMDYFYDYIEPMLLELNDKEILEYDRNKIRESSETRRNYLKAFSFLREVINPKEEEKNVRFKNDTQTIKSHFSIFGLDKYRQLCDDKGIFFLASNDTKPKKEFAEKIKELFIYEYKITTYSENYIKPLLANLSNGNKLKYFVNPKNEEERYINYSIEAIMMSILNGLFYTKTSLGEYETILSLIDNGSDDDKKKLAWIMYFDVFSTQFTDEDLKRVYEEALTYGHNKNKYGQYDYNNYNKVITTIFDIK